MSGLYTKTDYRIPSKQMITDVLPILYGFARYGRRWKMSLEDAQILGRLYTEFTGLEVKPLEMAIRVPTSGSK